MSIWQSHGKAGGEPRPLSLQEIAIFAGALVMAALVGIAASGLAPI